MTGGAERYLRWIVSLIFDIKLSGPGCLVKWEPFQKTSRSSQMSRSCSWLGPLYANAKGVSPSETKQSFTPVSGLILLAVAPQTRAVLPSTPWRQSCSNRWGSLGWGSSASSLAPKDLDLRFEILKVALCLLFPSNYSGYLEKFRQTLE